VQIVVHLGPHRTATTSIQSLLAASRGELSRSGIWYPSCRYVADAHHVLAWKILGRDLAAIGASAESRSAVEILLTWIEEARSHSCDAVLLSSEDFAVFRDTEWRILRSAVSSSYTWRLVASRRSPSDVAKSAYSHLLLSGLAQSFDEVSDVLAQGTMEFLSYFTNLIARNSWCTGQLIEYGGSSAFLRTMISVLIGEESCVAMIDRHDLPLLNSRFNETIHERLLAFNRLNTPDFVIDLATGAFPAHFYSTVDGERPKIAGVAELLQSKDAVDSRTSLAS